jgi:hypothetical protein
VAKRLVSVIAAACIAAVLSVSCSGTGSLEKSTPTMTPMTPQIPKEIQEQAERNYAFPLTGVPTSEKTALRPVMVMLNNHPSARPQSGISYADILYESLAEGELTRFAAIFQSARYDGSIGPVRSIRPYYIDLGQIYDALIIHAGGSPDSYTQLSEQNLDYLDEITNAGRFFWRESFRKAPHNLYTDMARVRSGTEKLGQRGSYAAAEAVPAFLPEEKDKPGQIASGVRVKFWLPSYTVSYTYDMGEKVYKRFINDAAHLDLSGRQQITATNVVILGAKHTILDREGRRDIQLTGSGQALVMQRGKAQMASWHRMNVKDRFHLLAEGEEIGLYPGKTHYLIVPELPSFEEHISVDPVGQ